VRYKTWLASRRNRSHVSEKATRADREMRSCCSIWGWKPSTRKQFRISRMISSGSVRRTIRGTGASSLSSESHIQHRPGKSPPRPSEWTIQARHATMRFDKGVDKDGFSGTGKGSRRCSPKIFAGDSNLSISLHKLRHLSFYNPCPLYVRAIFKTFPDSAKVMWGVE
jgi:hypothetical protein